MDEKIIKIHYPDGHHGYGIEFMGLENKEYDFDGFSYDGIKFFINTKCPKELSYFFQGGFSMPKDSMGWGFVEFWNAEQKQDSFLNFVIAISENFKIKAG